MCVARAVGMKMVADLQQFSGVNESILKQTILLKKRDIESKLKDTNRSQHCETKKVTKRVIRTWLSHSEF